MKPRIPPWLVVAFGAALVGPPRDVAGQDIRERYTIPVPENLEFVVQAARGAPGSSAGSPTAFGAGWGDVFIGAGYQVNTRYTDTDDGTLVAGLGIGSAQRALAIELAYTSFSTLRSDPFETNGLSFKIHRALPGMAAIAVGWENAYTFGKGESDGGSSVYGVITKVFAIESGPTLTVSAGAGNGRFRFEEDTRAGAERINFFGSLGMQFVDGAGIIADWTGQDLVVALSVVPFRSIPLVVTPGVADITGKAGDGARFTVGAGLGFRWL